MHYLTGTQLYVYAFALYYRLHFVYAGYSSVLCCSTSHFYCFAPNCGTSVKKISLNERGCREQKGNKGLPTPDRYSFINPSLHLCFFLCVFVVCDKDTASAIDTFF